MKKLYRSLLVLVFALCGATSVYADENIAVAVGDGYTLFLKYDGTVWAVGSNGYGQLGDGTLVSRSAPVQVVISDVVAIVAHHKHSLFLKNDGTVWAAGYNSYGQLANGTTDSSAIPVQSSITNVVQIAAEWNQSRFLKADGTVWYSGYGYTGHSATPTMIPGLYDVAAIAGGVNHIMSLKTDGTVWGFGDNGLGQLGNGTTTSAYTPVYVMSEVKAIAAGRSHSLFLKNDGTVWGAGKNTYGALGDGTTSNKTSPVQAVGINDVVNISASGYTSQYVKSDGTLWSAGMNEYGQFGDGTYGNYRTMPVQAIEVADIVSVDTGDYHSVALKEVGTAVASGYNYAGLLGVGVAGSPQTKFMPAVKGASPDSCQDTLLHLLPCGTIINATLQKVYQGGIPTTREQIAVSVKVFDESIKPIPPATQYSDVYLNEQAALVASCSAGTPCPVLAEGDYYVIAEYYDESGAVSYRMKPVTFSEGSMGVASLLFVSHYDSSYNLLWTH